MKATLSIELSFRMKLIDIEKKKRKGNLNIKRKRIEKVQKIACDNLRAKTKKSKRYLILTFDLKFEWLYISKYITTQKFTIMNFFDPVQPIYLCRP
jgi:hypothetical protein